MNGQLTGADVQSLAANPKVIGLYDWRSFREHAGSVLTAASIDGVAPSPETIADGTYPASRTFYLYINADHISRVPGLREFLALYVDEIGLARDWPGFVPLDAAGLAAARATAAALRPLPLPE